MADKYYLDTVSNTLHAFPGDGSMDKDIPYTFSLLTEEQFNEFINPPPTIDQLKVIQNKILTDACITTNQQSIVYMNTTFQADTNSQDILHKVLTGLGGTAPNEFYWVDTSNKKVTMNFTQLQGLASAMQLQSWTAFQKLQTLKAKVNTAKTSKTIQAITW